MPRPAPSGRPRGPRVLMTADALGGVWTYCLELARELSARGAEVLVATMGDPPDAARRCRLETLPGVTVETSDFALEWFDDPWDDVDEAGRWLLELARGFRPDVIHLNGFCHAGLPFGAPVVVVAHSCVLSWWRGVRGEEAPPRFDRYRDAVREGLAAADLVVAPTRALLDELAEIYGDFGRSRAIPNGRSARDLKTPAAERDRVVFACGRVWDDAKNLALLETAARHVPWPVEIAGATRGPTGVVRRLEHARPLGRLAPGQVARRLSAASIFAHPARYEPFGLAPLEAALCGCPLILGDLATLREVWGDAAVYVPLDDPEPLARALDAMIRSPSERRDRAARSRLRAASFTAEAMAERYLRAYEEVAS